MDSYRVMTKRQAHIFTDTIRNKLLKEKPPPSVRRESVRKFDSLDFCTFPQKSSHSSHRQTSAGTAAGL